MIKEQTEGTASAALPAIQSPRKSRLGFLDGLRGISALFVVFHHMWQRANTIATKSPLPRWYHAASIFKAGALGVDVFIVLSGFCLMLPIAKRGSFSLTNGLGDFVFRRAKRILPPYYAALALSLLAIALVPALRQGSSDFDPYEADGMGAAVTAHVFMVHNLVHEWAYRIDAPMWSVATEWQIYFVFALALLPLAKRFGFAVTAAAGFAFGIATILLHLGIARFSYVGLFALGMWSASKSFEPGKAGSRSMELSGYALAAIAAVCAVKGTFRGIDLEWPCDLILGIGAALVLCACARACYGNGTAPYLMPALAAPAAVDLGAYSYSIYLVHYLVVFALAIATKQHAAGPAAEFVLLVCLGTPIVLGISYLFHLLFERRFMNLPRPEPKVEPAAAAAS